MKRNQAPSKLAARQKERSASSEASRVSGGGGSGEDIIIERQSFLFGLNIPTKDQRRYVLVNKPFKNPGCRITKRSKELRNTQHLGAGYNKTPVLRPGDLSGFIRVGGLAENRGDGGDQSDDEGEQEPTAPLEEEKRLIAAGVAAMI